MKRALLSLLLGSLCAAQALAARPDADAVREIIRQVNTRWQQQHPTPRTAFWHEAAYHTGNMEVYALTGDSTAYAYSEAWADHNGWQGSRGSDPSRWRYDYGTTPDHVLFGDWQTCFQTYIDLDAVHPAPHKTARAREVMGYQIETPQVDYWWWADGIYMAMPVMAKMRLLTGDARYTERMHAYWRYARELMYDEEEALFYRDAKYLYPAHKTLAGCKDFWSRGNGWVVAALAKVLRLTPDDDPWRGEYEAVFRAMMQALARCQQPEGYWTRSLLDAAQAPGPETSGTAFFTYALLWGMNAGVLDEARYEPVAMRAWDYLTQVALQPDGSVGYVQPVGEKAIPGEEVGAASTADFGVGAFLHAACEMVRYLERTAGR